MICQSYIQNKTTQSKPEALQQILQSETLYDYIKTMFLNVLKIVRQDHNVKQLYDRVVSDIKYD